MVHTTCAALHCLSSSKTNKTLRFHQFPHDKERLKIWLEACRRTDLLDEHPDYFKYKYICSLHFEKSMYKKKNLIKSAFPTLLLSEKPMQYDCMTQTLDPIQFFKTDSGIDKNMEGNSVDDPLAPDPIMMVRRTCHTQTVECHYTLSASNRLEDKNKSKISSPQNGKYRQCDQTSHELNEFQNEIKKEKQEPSSLTKDQAQSVGSAKHDENSLDKSTQITEIDFISHKAVQTNEVIIYKIPKLKHYYQQCLQCSKRQKVANEGEELDEDLILEEFLKACDKFLSPMFSTTVKNQVRIEQILRDIRAAKSLKLECGSEGTVCLRPSRQKVSQTRTK